MAVMPVARARDFRRSFRRLVGALRPEAPLIALVAVLALVSVTFAIAGPRILGHATNLLFDGVIGKQLPAGLPKAQAVAALRAAGQDRLADMLTSMNVVPGQGVEFDALGRTLLLLLGVYLASALFGWAQGYLMAGVTQRTVYRMRRDVDEKLGRLPLSYFDRQSRGDILSRVTNDIDNIAQTLQQSLTQLITAILTVIGVLAMMLSISPLLAGVSLLTVPASVVITMLIARRSQKQFAAQWERTGELNGHIEEMHSGHTIVKVFGRQAEAIRLFDEHNDRVYDASFRAQFISGIIQPALNFVANLNYVAIAVIGGVRVASGRMTLGDVQAFIQYSRQFTMPIVQTASIMNVLQSAVASAERVFEVLDEVEEEPDPANPLVLREPRGRVALEGVSFRYEAETPLIEDLDLVVEPGSTVAIVGPTGAGKTTLVNLLMRFYEIDAGRITVDGIDIRDLARENLRCTFGMVLQDTWLFHGTIRENLAYGVDQATEEQIRSAARAAHVEHFVRTLPDGYNTVLEDEAANISQGERQLLTIARAFLVDPAILILDEATSSVDTRTEVRIQRAMATLMEGRTSFVIAHRLSTIRDADTILVMDAGRIVEQGTHAELIARRGFYAELYASQFEQAEPPPTSTTPTRASSRPAEAASAAAPTAMPEARPPVPVPGAPVVDAGAGRAGASGTQRRGPIVVGLLLALALLAGSIGSRNGGLRDWFLEPQATQAAAEAPATGPTVAVGPRIVAKGHVVPARAATLSFGIPGVLASIEAEEGQAVSAGEVLARLDGAVEAATLLVAEADHRAALVELTARQAAGRPDPRLTAGTDIDGAEADVDRAAARLELARLRSESTLLRAPFSGRVAGVEAVAFEALPAGSPVIHIMGGSGWLVETDDLSERDVVAVEPGDGVTVRLTALPGTVLEGNVLRVRPLGRTVQGEAVFTVVVRVLQTDERLRWNQSAEVTFAP